MIVAPIPIGARLADTIQVIGPKTAAGLKAAGVEGLIRYWETLERAEVDTIQAAKLGLCVVGYSRKPGWIPENGDGHRDADQLLAKMTALALPVLGATVWCDLEGCAGTVEQAENYLLDFGGVTDEEGAIGGTYVGAGQPLSGLVLYRVPTIHAYWRSQSSQIPEPQVGWQMIQLYPTTTVAGVGVDLNFAQRDYQGRAPTWLV